MKARIVLYSLLTICVLQTWAIWQQAEWLQKQRVLIRELFDGRKPKYHRPQHENWKV